MPDMYTKAVDTLHPSCILFLIDQSGSMSDPIANGNGRTKADSVADGINRCFMNLIIRSTPGSDVKPYFDLAVIGYGERVGSAWAGGLSGRDWVNIKDVAVTPARMAEKPGADGGKAKMPVWFEPLAGGYTPMRAAMSQARQLLENWLSAKKDQRKETGLDIFPPIVVNITDGASTDGEPADEVQALKNLKTDDGNVLVFNCHVTDLDAEPIKYPDSGALLPDGLARNLFDMSSVIPAPLRAQAKKSVGDLSEHARGMVFNADLASLGDFIDMGTKKEPAGR